MASEKDRIADLEGKLAEVLAATKANADRVAALEKENAALKSDAKRAKNDLVDFRQAAHREITRLNFLSDPRPEFDGIDPREKRRELMAKTKRTPDGRHHYYSEVACEYKGEIFPAGSIISLGEKDEPSVLWKALDENGIPEGYQPAAIVPAGPTTMYEMNQKAPPRPAGPPVRPSDQTVA